MLSTISCSCGWQTQCTVENSTAAQVIVDTHEAQYPRRAYRHRASYTLQRAVESERETIARVKKGVNRILGRF